MSETAPLSLGSQLGRLGRHSLIYGIGGLVSRIVAVLLLPLYTHYLTPADYGKIETLIALTTVLGIILRAGISSAFFRFYFDAEGDVARRTVLRTSFWFTMGAGTLGLLLLLVFAQPVSDFLFGTTNAANLVRAAGVALWASVNYEQLTSLFRVEERSVAFVCASLANVFITIGLTLVLVVSLDKGAIGVIVGNFSGTLIVYFALLGFRREQLGLQFDRGLLREMNRFGIPLVPTALFLWITNFSDRFFLVKLSDVSEAGLYSVGVRVASAMVLLLTAFRMAWPAFAYSIRDEDEAKRTYAYVLTYLTVVTAWVALALTLFAPWLVDLLATPRFAESYRVVGPLSFAAVAFAAYIVVAIGVGRIRRTQFNWVVTGAAAIVNVALNLALIPPYGMIGAAIATVAAYVTMAVGMAWWSQRIYPVPYQWRRVVTAAAAAVGLAVLGKGLDVGFGAAFALCAGLPAGARGAGLHEPRGAPPARAARHALEQCLLEQEDVQADDHRRDRGRHDRRRPPVDERAHQLRSRQNQSSGINANGIPNESATWLSTSAREASTPAAMMISAGAIVIARRRNSGIRRRMKPCITICPASVPTLDDESPDARSATPKRRFACPPSCASSWSATCTRSSPTSVRPCSWKTAAAMISMLMLTTPAIPIAIITSTSSNR